jgi:FKBP-type peptidyl-prolyl cis-trans isomerase FkpA
MRTFIVTALITLIALPAFAAEEPKTEEQKTLYAIGLIMARQLSVFNLSAPEFEMVKQGLADGMAGKTPLVELDAYKKKTQDLAIARRDALGERLAAEAKVFMAKAAQEKGAVQTKSGAIYLELKPGEGTSPTATDKVRVNYRGTLVNGTEFDSSYQRGKPVEFALNAVIPCWTEGVQMMKPGGKARLVCPADTAYGSKGSGPVPPNATLVFEVELVDIAK